VTPSTASTGVQVRTNVSQVGSLPPCSANRVPGTRRWNWSAETARSPRPCTAFPDHRTRPHLTSPRSYLCESTAKPRNPDRHAATRRLRRLAVTAGLTVTGTYTRTRRHTFVMPVPDAGAGVRDVQPSARHADPAPRCVMTGPARTLTATRATSWSPYMALRSRGPACPVDRLWGHARRNEDVHCTELAGVAHSSVRNS
jgi:hypothetical protein